MSVFVVVAAGVVWSVVVARRGLPVGRVAVWTVAVGALVVLGAYLVADAVMAGSTNRSAVVMTGGVVVVLLLSAKRFGGLARSEER